MENTKYSITKYGNHIYSNLWYCDDKNKICITFTPRGGCSISFKCYLVLICKLEEGEKYNDFIHCYRCDIFDSNLKHHNIEYLIEQKYTFIKFIMNPYIRAVSVYLAQTSHNLSFKNYLKQLVNNEIDYFNENDKFHYHQQYIEGEEKIITKYIKINENEKYTIKLANGEDYILDVNKYTSQHHTIKFDIKYFVGDIQKDKIQKNNLIPKSYKYFYDDEIKILVEQFYKKDIEMYNFTFDF
jgi:hypothetical protein